MKWFRLYHEALDDPKVQTLPGDTFKAWINLLCLASRSNERGVIRLDVAGIAFALRMPEDQAEALLADLIERGLIEQSSAGYEPHNWNARQFKSDNVTARTGKHREQRADTDETLQGTFPRTLHATLPRTMPETLKPSARADTETDSEAEAEADTEQTRVSRETSVSLDRIADAGLRAMPGPEQSLGTDSAGRKAWVSGIIKRLAEHGGSNVPTDEQLHELYKGRDPRSVLDDAQLAILADADDEPDPAQSDRERLADAVRDALASHGLTLSVRQRGQIIAGRPVAGVLKEPQLEALQGASFGDVVIEATAAEVPT